MTKVAPISKRKDDHLKINLEQDVASGISSGLEKYFFTHQALPELDLESIDTSLKLFGKSLSAPILISSMTGGSKDSKEINVRLAAAAQETGIAMGVGSQRAGIDHPKQADTFKVRQIAPDVLLFANLGAIQLNYGYGLDECKRAVEMIEADALILHLNPLQEALQAGGDTNWKGLAKRIENVCKHLSVPVIAKEVGWGISEATARLLINCGVSAIDVAGAGGTSWSQVEMHRAPNLSVRELAASFKDWGIGTVESIQNVHKVNAKMPVFASGGLKDGVDIAKSVALGATLGGLAGFFLQAAAESAEKTIERSLLLKRQMQVAMFAAGAGNLTTLRHLKLSASE